MRDVPKTLCPSVARPKAPWHNTGVSVFISRWKSGPSYVRRLVRLRAQRWSREALLAVILTIAAVVFIATAMVGKDSPDEGKEAVARTPQN